MNPPDLNSLSRREWLERVSGPAAAASFGLMLAGAPSAARAQDAGAATSPGMAAAGAGGRVFNVRDFGACGDGVTLDSSAVQAAIDAAAAQGGAVLVPAGDFVVGTLQLKSHVTLRLATRGRLLGSPDPKHYSRGEGIPPGNGNIVLLYTANAENVSIEGNGTIDGNGLKFWTGQGDNTGPGGNRGEGYFDRPHQLIFYRVNNLRLRDVNLVASAYHCTRILQCEQVHFDGVRIYNRVNKNNDGFHFNSCRRVHVTNCDVQCQDDACALFGSNKWVTITNCTFSTRWSIFRFGGGECEHIAVSNCLIYDTYGCAIKMGAGGSSRHENISFSNLILRNVTGPISLGFQPGGFGGGRGGANAAPTGYVRNISFKNIRAYVVAEGRQYPDMHWEQGYREGERRTCITLNGVGEAFLENITLSDVHVIYEGGGTKEEAAIRDVPPVAGEYFQIGPRPAYGLYARNVRGLTLQNVRLEFEQPDVRPAIVFDNVSDAALCGLTVKGNADAESALRLAQTRDVLLSATRLHGPAKVFLRLEGAGSDGIAIEGGDIAQAAQPVECARGAKAEAVRVRA